METPYTQHRAIRVTIRAVDFEQGEEEILDEFIVCHYKSEDAMSFSDEENVGSRASEALLMDRIRRYVKEAVR